MTTSADETGNSWVRTSNALGQLTTVVEPGGLQTGYTYDGLGNLNCVEQHGNVSGTGCSSPSGNDATSAWRIRRFSYDTLGRLTSSKTPEAGTISYNYLNGTTLCSGNVSLPCVVTDARGVTVTASYDALNRLTNKNYSDGTQPVAYGYDGNIENGGGPASQYGIQSLNAIGDLQTGSNDVNAATAYSYDSMGRVVLQSVFLPSNGYWSPMVSALYDLAGNMTDLTYPDGHHIKQTFNNAGQYLPRISWISTVPRPTRTTFSRPATPRMAHPVRHAWQWRCSDDWREQPDAGQNITVSTPLPPFSGNVFFLIPTATSIAQLRTPRIMATSGE